MRYRVLCCFILSCLWFWSSAQECNFPLAPANICSDAPLLCDLDGYCSNNSNATDTGTPNAFCGVVENNHWMAFLAGSESLTLQMTVDNCNIGSGLQAQIFRTNNCENFSAVSNCIDPAVTSATLTATGLVLGEKYFLMIDGKGGDVCDYSLQLLDGETLSPANAFIEPAGVLCAGETLSLNSTGVSANPGLMFQWSSPNGSILEGETTPTILIDTPGDYHLLIADAGGCTDSAEVNIPVESLPDFTIAEPDTINCLTGLQVTMHASPIDPDDNFSYSWSTTNGIIQSGAETANPIVVQAGNYFVVATDVTSGCTASQNVVVIADAATPVANILGGVELNCLIDTIALSSAGSSQGSNFVYNWQSADGNLLTASNSNEALLDAPGSYTLTVRNVDNGCEAVATQQVVLNNAEPESARLALQQPCFGIADGAISILEVLGGTPPYEIMLSVGEVPASYTDLVPGPYDLQIIDQIGCRWDTTLQLVEQAEFLLDLGPDLVTGLGCEVPVKVLTNRDPSELDTLIWEPWLDCQNCLDFTFVPLESSAYQLTAFDVNGCMGTAQLRITVDKERKVFIPNVFSPNGDGSNDVFYLQSGKAVAQILQYQIYDRWGNLVAEQSSHAPDSPDFGWDGRIAGELAANGIYLYVATIEFVDGKIEQRTGDVLLLR